MPSIPHPVTALQDLMFHELHHRFYNSLQLVSSAVGILASDVCGPNDIRLLRDRIATLGGIHRTLARPLADLGQMRDSFEGLCVSLTEGFAHGTVTLSLDVMVFPQDPMVVRGLTLILVELVTNALKHGAGNDAPIRVVLGGDVHSLRLSVANAVASAEHHRCLPHVATRFAEALGGTLTVASTPEHIVRVIVPIPGAARGIEGAI